MGLLEGPTYESLLETVWSWAGIARLGGLQATRRRVVSEAFDDESSAAQRADNAQ